MRSIDAMSDQDLMEQAQATAATYFHRAVRDIDEVFGDGYAKANPRLIESFMGACAADFDTAMRIKHHYEK